MFSWLWGGQQAPAPPPRPRPRTPTPPPPPPPPRAQTPPVSMLRDDDEYTEDQLTRLEARFYEQTAATGPHADYLSPRGLGLMPELAGNPFVKRFFVLFDLDGDEWLSLDEFLALVKGLRRTSNLDAKRALAFDVLDADGDGFISASDLAAALRPGVGRALPEAVIVQAAEKAVREHDGDGDGFLSYTEFVPLVSTSDLLQKFTIDWP